MKHYGLIKKLEQYPLFTENDISKLINKSPEYIRTLLYRLSKEGIIKRIERGKYTLYDDAMVFASYLVTPSYIGMWSALRHHNMTQQQPFAISILSPISRKKLKFLNTEILFIKSKHIFGYKKERYSDFDIFISDKEKTLIDALLFHFPLEDIVYAVANAELNLEKLTEFAKRTNNTSLIKRLGYLLERKKGSSYGLKAMDNNYIKLDYLSKRKGKKDAKWKLIINTEI